MGWSRAIGETQRGGTDSVIRIDLFLLLNRFFSELVMRNGAGSLFELLFLNPTQGIRDPNCIRAHRIDQRQC